MITSFELHKKIHDLGQSGCTLLWLEGTRTEHVLSVRVNANRLILSFLNGTSYLFAFEQCIPTGVGLQFWNSSGKPGVLYRWEQLPQKPQDVTVTAVGSESEKANHVLYMHEWRGGH